MILRKALPQCGGLIDQVGVIAGLRPEQSRLERTWIAQTVRAAVAVNLVKMDGKNLDDGQIVRHSASFL